jgi:hypothetical protein
MDGALLIVRLLLAMVFAVAALAKLADFPNSAKSVADFGMPQAFVAPVTFALPLVELFTAGLLVPVSTAWWGALGALSLLAVFMVVIGVNLARGHRPDCRCFGQLHSEPAGWRTLARNGVLAAVAGFVLWHGTPHAGLSAIHWLGALSAMQVALLVTGLTMAVAISMQGWFLFQLLRQHGRLLLRMDALESVLAGLGAGPLAMQPARRLPAGPALLAGLPVGAPAPAFQ